MAQRGLDQRHEQNQLQLIRDTRTIWQRIGDFLKNPLAVSVTLIMLAVTSFVVPAVADFLVIIGLFMFTISCVHRHTLPFRMPQSSDATDHNDKAPGSGKSRKARGIYFFG